MAGIDGGVLFEGEETLANAVNQGIEVSAWKIRAADGALEKRVTHKDTTIGVQRYTARGMARGMDHFETELTHRNGIAVFHHPIRRG